jgi:hypothetical protein
MMMMMTMIIYKQDFNAHEHVLDAKTGAKIQILIVDTRDHFGDLEVERKDKTERYFK